MRIAVLGSNSFSGKAFSQVATEAGHEVFRMSRPTFNLRYPERILEAVRSFRPSVFVNYAALNVVADSWRHYEDYYRTNTIGVTRLADRLRGFDFLDRFVQVSTPEVYGREAYCWSGPGAPNTIYLPSTPYAVSRAAADMHLEALHHSFGFPVCFTRTVNVYGPGQQTYRIIPKTVLKILRGEKLKLEGGGSSRRSFIHVKDMALGTLAVVQSGKSGEIYHFATPYEIEIRALVALICSQMGVEFERAVEVVNDRPGKDRMYFLDWSNSKSELGWEPTIPLVEGLEETVSWFKEHAHDYVGNSLEYEHRP